MGVDAPPLPSSSAVLSSEQFRIAKHNQNINNIPHEAGVSEAVPNYPVQSPKTVLNVEKAELADSASTTQLLASPSKDSIVNQNVSDVTNISVIKKAGWSSLRQNMQMPSITTKLLNKTKKDPPGLQGALIAKVYLPDTENSNTALIPPRVEGSEKVDRKNKKILHNLLKPRFESSSISSDYCNSVLQPHKIEKYLKRQSKHQRKLLHKHKQGEILKKNLYLPKVLGDKLPILLTSSPKTLSDIPVLKDSALSEVPKEKICLPKPGLTETSPPTFSQSCPNDNSFCVKDSGSALDNLKQSPNAIFHDKKTLTGAKLTAELDRNKLNIFKKISKQKSQKPSSPNNSHLPSQISGGSNGQFINLPCGTTITLSPPGVKCIISSDTNLHNSDLIEKKSKVSVNCEQGGAISYARNIAANSISGVIIPNQLSHRSLKVNETTKPKKRGRKPGSKNLPKQTILAPMGADDVTHLKKLKKLKASKSDQQYLHLEARNSVDNKMELSNLADDLIPTLSHGDDVITSCLPTNIKDTRKERKKSKIKSLPLNMSTTEQNEYNAEAAIPTKEEVNTINKKLMRMDTILQPLGGFNDATINSNADILKILSHKPLPYKSPTSRKRQSPHILLQPHTNPIVMHGAHQPFMSKPVIGGIPDLLKLCPFPPGPGLIPPTAQNILFPRLPSTFQLPIPNFKPQGAAKLINTGKSN